jgi:hypothetical protein
MRDYQKLLLAIQETRFDLGLDEYRKGLPPANTSVARRTTDDAISETYKVAAEIFESRGWVAGRTRIRNG